MKQILTCFALFFIITTQAQHYSTTSTGVITQNKSVKNFYVIYGEGLQYKKFQIQAEGMITFSSGAAIVKVGYEFKRFECNVGIIDNVFLRDGKFGIKQQLSPITEAKIKITKDFGINISYTNGFFLAGIFFKNKN